MNLNKTEFNESQCTAQLHGLENLLSKLHLNDPNYLILSYDDHWAIQRYRSKLLQLSVKYRSRPHLAVLDLKYKLPKALQKRIIQAKQKL